MPERSLRILIVAADALTRAGLAAILATQPDLQSVGQLDPTEDLDDALAVFQPDVILWDVGYVADDALDALAEFTQLSSAPTIPILALLADSTLATAVWQAGVRALIPRSAPIATLAAALQAAAANLVVLDTSSASSVLVPAIGLPYEVEPLTAREREVLQLMAQGLPNKSIARDLAISEHTVKFHVNAILSKFGAQSRTEAVVLASRAGLVML
ncbi:MAG: response regulator transcription factor [Caldilineaceae bacterium]|nr:response regulator transcription factor [Caldilineaceae bacterium]